MFKWALLWHDGKPFTADDVVFSADVFLHKAHARLPANLASVESIKAIGPHPASLQGMAAINFCV